MKITISEVQEILSIIQEEGTVLGFEHNEDIAKAVETIDTAIQRKLDAGEVKVNDALVTL